jgi:hypothetical protein
VNTNSALQSVHFKTLSLNSMAGFPKKRRALKSAMPRKNLPIPLPCLRTAINNQGPDRNKFSGKHQVAPASRKDLDLTITQSVRRSMGPKVRIATGRPGFVSLVSCPHLVAESPGRRVSRLFFEA